MNSIRERIMEEIKYAQLNQTEIAQRLHLRQQTVNMYANGKLTPSLEVFAELCKLLESDANYILGITDYSGKKNT